MIGDEPSDHSLLRQKCDDLLKEMKVDDETKEIKDLGMSDSDDKNHFEEVVDKEDNIEIDGPTVLQPDELIFTK